MRMDHEDDVDFCRGSAAGKISNTSLSFSSKDMVTHKENVIQDLGNDDSKL